MILDAESIFFERACKQSLHDATTPALVEAGIELILRRDDLLDAELSGNKAYKLFYHLQAARAGKLNRILSFGGAYSNHLHALAFAGERFGFKTLGVIRGEAPKSLSPTLQDARDAGMELLFINRTEYQRKSFDNLLQEWRDHYGDFYVIPEGGAGVSGARGMSLVGRALERQLQGQYDAVCIATGTGTSLAGIAAGLVFAGRQDKLALGFSVLKGDGDLGTGIATTYDHLIAEGLDLTNPEETTNRPRTATNWRLISGFHAGGYGKKHPQWLYKFWQAFEHHTGIPLDPVYTLKMIWGIHCLAKQGYWPRGSRIIAIHSGGLQGRRGFVAPHWPQTPWVDVHN